MKVPFWLVLIAFYAGFVSRCLMSISCKRFIKKTLGKLAHF